MKKILIVLLCCLFLIGCGNKPMAGHREDIGLGRAEERNMAIHFERIEAGTETRDILDIWRADFSGESPSESFRVSPELALDIANAVFLSWRYDDWDGYGRFLRNEYTSYYIHDFEQFYIISRWNTNAIGRTYNIAIDKTNGRILSIWMN